MKTCFLFIGEDGLGEDVDSDATVKEAETTKKSTEEFSSYKKLCRGESDLSPAYVAKLKCRYDFGHHPYLRLAPYKSEDVYLNPRLTIYYDVLLDSETNTVKEFASPRVHLFNFSFITTLIYMCPFCCSSKGPLFRITKRVSLKLQIIASQKLPG